MQFVPIVPSSLQHLATNVANMGAHGVRLLQEEKELTASYNIGGVLYWFEETDGTWYLLGENTVLGYVATSC